MDFASQIGEPTLQELFSRWEDKAVGGCVPTRADFDPLALPAHVLPFVFILERHDERFFCRLAGTGIRTMLGFEASQRYLDDMIPHTHSVTRGDIYARVMDEQTPAYFSGGMAASESKDRVVSCLLLPVSARGGIADQVFGVMMAKAETHHRSLGWVRAADGAVVAWAA